ncbi:MAG: DUF2147 domain-containing protein [Flavobacteriales bacterium]|nr:DUF2147 domain-containing protein [Flavobacteriales bacterium]
MIKNLSITGLFIISLILSASAQKPDDVLGKWKTIDDETGKAKSIVEVYKENGKVYGKVITILNPDKQNAKCDKCDDDDPRKGQKVLGMVILKDLEWDDDEWDDGTILDPNNGSVYDCKIWIDSSEPDKLNVRGYVAFIFRTQNWYREK